MAGPGSDASFTSSQSATKRSVTELSSRLPSIGGNPSSQKRGTTPGSFANPAAVGTPLAFSSPDTPGMPQPSDKSAWDFMPPDWRLEGDRWVAPEGFEPVTQLEFARLGVVTAAMRRVAEREPHLTEQNVRDEVAAGRMVIPANTQHLRSGLDPMAIGRASLTKVNANMGASPVSSGTDEEVEKLDWALRWKADTVMDLSTGGDLDATRNAIIQNSSAPIGTVPIYSMIIGRSIEDLDEASVLETLEHQAKQGVDYFTIHAGVLRAHLPLVRDRVIGIVSRGGALLAKWMLHHDRENLMYEMWDDICALMRRYDVTFSIGDGLRPGGLSDATDAAQLAELQALGTLTERAWRNGCQVMVEGPGHVSFDQIEFNMKLQRQVCHGAPFYVLGPLVTDIFPGYDHITSCIGATAAAYHGASMLCYVTPKEHLGLPKHDDVKQGCVAYRIAAHAADVALGIPGTRDRDDELTTARAALNWEKHFELSFDPDTARAYHDEDLDVDTDFCAMCGHDWCSVRISKEIVEFVSGKDENYAWDQPKVSAALTAEQREILEKRGVLDSAEIHRLAQKTRREMGGSDGDKAACHSDLKSNDEANLLQVEKLEVSDAAPRPQPTA
jgi:phosphomethylpyrimidine synthase